MVAGSNAKTIVPLDGVRPHVRSFDFSLTEVLDHGDVLSDSTLPRGVDERIPICPNLLGNLAAGKSLVPVLKRRL